MEAQISFFLEPERLLFGDLCNRLALWQHASGVALLALLAWNLALKFRKTEKSCCGS